MPAEVRDSSGHAPRPSRGGRRGAPRLHETSVEFEVPFHDVDALRVVWHGHYYKYLELARTRLLRSRKLDVADFSGLPVRVIMVESACRYVSPLHYADRVRISAWFRDVRNRICIDYEVTNLTRGRRAARARTILASTDLQGRLLLRTPEVILERIAPDAPAVGTR